MAQIGTIKLQTQNSGVVDVPVFDTGDSGSGIYEFVRVETTSGTGFIPTTDPADATYPFLRVQSQNQGVVALTDTENAIPDSVVSWTLSNPSQNNPEKQGIQFNSTEQWPEFGATLSSGSGDVTQAYLYAKSNLSSPIATKDISGVSGGGSFTITGLNLSAGTDYVLVADDNGDDYNYDYDVGLSTPIDSADGKLTLVSGYKVGGGNTGESIPHVFEAIGNVQ